MFETKSFLRWAGCALALAMMVLAGACGESPSGNQQPSGEQDAGDWIDAACTPGDIDCACTDEGTCTTGSCIDGECFDCSPGEEYCGCRSNGSCNAGLQCQDERCETCPEGTDGCACDPLGACQGELECQNGVCAESTCQPGQLDCPCRVSGDGEQCDGLAICSTDGICRSCGTDEVGCPCDAGACSGGLVCGDDDTCRDTRTCADLVADGDCAENQECIETPGQDATCTPATCVEDYRWLESAGVCTACVTPDCAAEPSCDPNDPNTIASQCDAEYRSCIEDAAGVRCGDCIPNTVLQDGVCVAESTCNGQVCGADEYCDTANGACALRPCAADEAQDSAGACQACNITCVGDGLSGNVWPFQTQTGECVCETQTGYYLEPGSQTAVLCDADQDSWVRRQADDSVINSSAAYKQNSRCDIRRVDGFVLVDEYGQGLEVGSCVEGLIVNPDATNCSQRLPIRLLETERNDVPGKPIGPTAPLYGSRNLQANELNPLTRACSSELADYNDNGVEDLVEHQVHPDNVGADEKKRLDAFTFFMELYRASYRAGASADAPGKMVIEPRSRCDDDFPFQYDDVSRANPYEPSEGATYWRNCSRWVDSNYSEPNHIAATASSPYDPGFDFMHWLGQAGLPGPADDVYDATNTSIDARYDLIREHGACELAGTAPADGVWRGLLHSSQFKCVQITANPNGESQRAPSDFMTNGSLVLNTCDAGVTRPVTSGGRMHEPEVDCQARLPANPMDDPTQGVTVGWAAVKYASYGNANGYQRGCVDEDVHWGDLLCPYPEYCLDTPNSDDFGRYSCYGMAPNYLWAEDANSTRLATLYWSGGVNMSVWSAAAAGACSDGR